jgi:hypothetical protein
MHFNGLRPKWLETGEGEMFYTETEKEIEEIIKTKYSLFTPR